MGTLCNLYFYIFIVDNSLIKENLFTYEFVLVRRSTYIFHPSKTINLIDVLRNVHLLCS